MPSATAIYCRISRDRREEELGVKRQQEDCVALCERRGWPVAGVYIDNDVSAFGKKRRPQYEQLLADLRAGKVDSVVVWHPDRLHRSPRELEDFIDVIESCGAAIGNCTAGDYDLGSPDGRLMARIVGSVARKESEDKSRRLRRKHVELAQAGKVSGGGRRPFGYESDRVTIREDEAAVIRQAVADILAGSSIRSIAARWNEAGVPSVTGVPWASTTVKRLLISGRIAGQREHQGKVVADAAWPAIITPAQSAQIRAVMSDAARVTSTTNAREYLLGGFVYCGACGNKLTARPVIRKGHRYRRYACTVDRGGCNRVGIGAEPLEEVITEALFDVLASAEFAAVRKAQAASAEWDEIDQAIKEDEAAIEQMARDHYVDHIISREVFVAGQRGLQARLDDNRRRLARHSLSAGAADALADITTLRAEWDGGTMTLDRKRAILDEALLRIVIAPTTRSNNRFDPDRLEVVWRM